VPDFVAIGKHLLAVVGPAIAAAPLFKEVWDDFVGLAGPQDQEKLKATYAELIAENDAGYQRLDDKLADAEKRG
jgi:hypothetical protein